MEALAAAEGAHYMYVEASYPRATGDTFGLGYDGSSCRGVIDSVSFMYEMYGPLTAAEGACYTYMYFEASSQELETTALSSRPRAELENLRLSAPGR